MLEIKPRSSGSAGSALNFCATAISPRDYQESKYIYKSKESLLQPRVLDLYPLQHSSWVREGLELSYGRVFKK